MSDFERRLMPASNAEIITLAGILREDPVLIAAFERCGYDGDMTVEEDALLEAAINAFRRGEMWDRDPFHLVLAPCLVRRLVSGRIDSLDSAAAHEFLEDRKVVRLWQGIETAPPSASQVMEIARAFRNEPEIWNIYLRVKEEHSETDKESNIIFSFKVSYLKKYGLYIQDMAIINAIGGLLKAIAAGRIGEIDSDEAWAFIRNIPSVKNYWRLDC